MSNQKASNTSVAGAEISAFGVRLVRLSLLESPAFKVEKSEFIEFDLSKPEDVKLLAARIQKSLQRLQITRKQPLLACVSPPSFVFKNLKLPLVKDEELNEVAYWSFNKQQVIEQDTHIFDYCVSPAPPNAKQLNAWGFSAERKDIRWIINAFKLAGHPLAGMTFVPFAIQNLLTTGVIPPAKHSQAFIWIDETFAHIAVFQNKQLLVYNSVNCGTRHLLKCIQEDVPILSKDADARQALLSFINPEHVGNSGSTIQNNQLFAGVFRGLEKLKNSLLQTIARTPMEHVFLLGEPAACFPIMEHFRQTLGIQISVVKFSSTDSSSVQGTQALAVASALSSPETSNILRTRRDNTAEKHKATHGNRILAFTALFSVIMLSVFGFQLHSYISAKDKLAASKLEAESGANALTKEQIATLVSQINVQQQSLKSLAMRQETLVLLGDLCNFTDSNMKLIGLNADLEGVENIPTFVGGKVNMELMILGDESSQETRLTSYIALLGESPLINNVSHVEYKRVEVEKSPALRVKLIVEPALDRLLKEHEAKQKKNKKP